MATLSALILLAGALNCLGSQLLPTRFGAQVTVYAGHTLTIVSAQFGANDRIDKLPDLPDGTRGFFYTESSGVITGTGWEVVHRPYHRESCDDAAASSAWCNLDVNGKYSMSQCTDTSVRGVMAARFYKMNAYLLPETAVADLILWSDADELSSVTPFPSDLNERAAALIGDADLVLPEHGERHSVTEEVHPAALRAAQRTGQPAEVMEKGMLEGIACMKAQGFLDDAGLHTTTQFLYWRTRSSIQKAMDDWWKFNQQYSFRDQISAPWAFKKNDVQIKHVCKSMGDACVMRSIVSIGL
eukprot:TRINITY_DN644_c0_g1_i1.p1 TRINITY_DN644_c0_g1~~TRINITY_DN644_c0_g1_i1.p1  ORF type:complete len:299 (+),score=37.97 TRINITY_DN644_c0_g1_i1:82-978(+)